MQLYLLQTHRFLSNFSNNLVGVFIPLLVYQYMITIAGTWLSIFVALATMAAIRFMDALFVMIFKKFLFSKPQLCLLLRIIPIFLFELLIIFIDKSPIVCIIGICVFSALSSSFGEIPNTAIYNYVSTNKKERTLGWTAFIEQMGYVVALVGGGLFLDNLPIMYLIIASLAIYTVSVIPLVVFYIMNKKNPTFNQEAITNAEEFYSKADNAKTRKVKKKFILGYLLYTSLACIIDVFYCLLSFSIYIGSSSFFMSGIMCGLFDFLYGLSYMFVGYWYEKKDLKVWAILSGIFICVSYLVIAFVNVQWLTCVLFALNGAVYPVLVMYVYQSLLNKSRILGVSNRVLLARTCGWYAVEGTGYLFAGLCGIIPGFIFVAVVGITGSVLIGVNEDKTNKLLVDFINDNDIPS